MWMFDDHNVFASLPSNWSVDYLYCRGARIHRNCKIDCPLTQYAYNSCSLKISRGFCTCWHMITCPCQTKLCWLVKLPYSVSICIRIHVLSYSISIYIYTCIDILYETCVIHISQAYTYQTIIMHFKIYGVIENFPRRSVFHFQEMPYFVKFPWKHAVQLHIQPQNFWTNHKKIVTIQGPQSKTYPQLLPQHFLLTVGKLTLTRCWRMIPS